MHIIGLQLIKTFEMYEKSNSCKQRIQYAIKSIYSYILRIMIKVYESNKTFKNVNCRFYIMLPVKKLSQLISSILKKGK